MTMAPPQPHEEFISRPRLDEMPTRRRMSWWDRIKILLVLVGLFVFFVAAEVADNPILPISEAIESTLRTKVWLLVLIGLEVLRQIHYVVSEHSARYHQFWSNRVFGRWNAFVGRFNPWNRYRAARAAKIIAVIVVGAIILGRIFDVSPVLSYLRGAPRGRRRAPPVHPDRAVPLVLDRVPVRHDHLPRHARRGGDVLPRRHPHPLLRRVGPGPGEAEDPREPDVPREARARGGEGRLRARRHPPLGTARHRQDAHGRGARRRDRPPVREHRRVDAQHDGHGRAQGEAPLPQAARATR